MKDQYKELKTELERTISTGDFATIKGELKEAIAIYEIALERANKLYEETQSEEDHLIIEQLKETIKEINDGMDLEKEELGASELSKELQDQYQEFVNIAHHNLNRAELSIIVSQIGNALKFYERAAHFANRAAGIYPTTRALKLLYYAADKVCAFSVEIGQIKEAITYEELALSVIKDLYSRDKSDKNAQYLTETLLTVALLKYDDGDTVEGTQLLENVLDFLRKRAEEYGRYTDYREEFEGLLKIAFFLEQKGGEEESKAYYKKLETLINEMSQKFGEEAEQDVGTILPLIQSKL